MAYLTVSGGVWDLRTAAQYNYGLDPDTIGISGGNTIVWTGDANDLVYSWAGAGTYQHVNLGSGHDLYYGGAGVDSVEDHTGNDWLYLGDGNDLITAGAGDDYYDGQAGFDTIYLSFMTLDDGSYLTNYSSVVCDLDLTSQQYLGVFGWDTLISIEKVVGSYGSDSLFAANGGSTLDGHVGNDWLAGRAGADTLIGNDGADTLVGGGGQDQINLSEVLADYDRVVFQSISDSAVDTWAADVLTGFDTGGGASDDRIDVSAIDANATLAGDQAFIWRGTLRFGTNPAGEINFYVLGADTFVRIDTDADSAAEMTIKVAGVTGLTSADFIL